MTSDRLENLARMGRLKKEPPRQDELDGLRFSGLRRLADAERSDLSFESRFDLADNAAHALSLFALRRKGYRSEDRNTVFQVLSDTGDLASGHVRVLSEAHRRRNLSEYEGYLQPDERLLSDIIAATHALVVGLGLND